MRVSRERLIVGGLCLADLVSTVWFVHYRGAVEANVVMRYYLERGLMVFAGAKVCFFVPALVMAEWGRRRNPRLIMGTLRMVIVLYVGVYSIGVFSLNQISAAKRHDPFAGGHRVGIQAPLERSTRLQESQPTRGDEQPGDEQPDDEPMSQSPGPSSAPG